MNARISAALPADPLDIGREAPTEGSAAPRKTRSVRFRGRAADCPVHARRHLPRGSEIRGPAIVEEAGSVTVVWPSDVLRVDPRGNLRLEVGRK